MICLIGVFAFRNPTRKGPVQSEIDQLRPNLVFWQLLQLSNANIARPAMISKLVVAILRHPKAPLYIVVLSNQDLGRNRKSEPTRLNFVSDLHCRYEDDKRLSRQNFQSTLSNHLQFKV